MPGKLVLSDLSVTDSLGEAVSQTGLGMRLDQAFFTNLEICPFLIRQVLESS